jgi:hypothetical protein
MAPRRILSPALVLLAPNREQNSGKMRETAGKIRMIRAPGELLPRKAVCYGAFDSKSKLVARLQSSL